MSKAVLALAALPAFVFFAGRSSPASAQVIFEPVRYQYTVNDTAGSRTFYYGGTDPRAFAYAARTVGSDGVAGPREGRDVHDVRYAVGTSYRGPLDSRPPAVLSDRFPYVDAALFGYTSADARNDANATVPTYFRKADLLASAIPVGGTALVVPAQAPLPAAAPVLSAPLIDIRPSRRPAGTAPATNSTTRPAAPATAPAEGPKPLLIIPKSLLRPPAAVPAAAERSVAVAKSSAE